MSECSNRTRLQRYIEDRLNKYGFSQSMSPTKYYAYSAIRRTVSIRLGLSDGKSELSNQQLIESIHLLDEILPDKDSGTANMKTLELEEVELSSEDVNTIINMICEKQVTMIRNHDYNSPSYIDLERLKVKLSNYK